MFRLIFVLLTLLGFGVNNNAPTYSLHKKEDKTKVKMDKWILDNWNFIALTLLLICVIAFLVVCVYICGLSATESGMMRNFINGGMI